MKDWKNVMALGKWKSNEAISYDVNATPTYFILNKDKRIIAKPREFLALLQRHEFGYFAHRIDDFQAVGEVGAVLAGCATPRTTYPAWGWTW